MGNSLKKQKEASLAANNTKKSKGERLGWKSISEYKTVSLKEIVGNGNYATKSLGGYVDVDYFDYERANDRVTINK